MEAPKETQSIVSNEVGKVIVYITLISTPLLKQLRNVANAELRRRGVTIRKAKVSGW